MEEQIINFQTAKLAEEKGFLAGSRYYYENENLINNYGAIFINGLDSFIEAPTQGLLQKWLREQEIPIIIAINFGGIDDSESAYTWHIKKYLPEGKGRKKDEWDFWEDYDSFISSSGDWYKTYEDALEAALQKALKLIK